jgi:hypothetical protein
METKALATNPLAGTRFVGAVAMFPVFLLVAFHHGLLSFSDESSPFGSYLAFVTISIGPYNIAGSRRQNDEAVKVKKG